MILKINTTEGNHLINTADIAKVTQDSVGGGIGKITIMYMCGLMYTLELEYGESKRVFDFISDCLKTEQHFAAYGEEKPPKDQRDDGNVSYSGGNGAYSSNMTPLPNLDKCTLITD